MSDTELIRRVAAGEQGALRLLYEEFRLQVYNVAHGYVQDRSDAEEITQDVFLEIAREAKRFRGASAVGTWIYRITVNKSLDKVRYRSRKKRFAQLVSLFRPTDGSLAYDPPDTSQKGPGADQGEDARLLFGAIGRLPEKQRSAVILTFMEDLSQKEAAEVLGVSPKAVESLLQRAKVNLRTMLSQEFPERGNTRPLSSN